MTSATLYLITILEGVIVVSLQLKLLQITKVISKYIVN
jgi:hypothetical protein